MPIELKARTGCNGVMIGRGALRNPWLFCKQTMSLERGEASGNLPWMERKSPDPGALSSPVGNPGGQEMRLLLCEGASLLHQRAPPQRPFQRPGHEDQRLLTLWPRPLTAIFFKPWGDRRPVKVKLAKTAGFCMGVRRALEMVLVRGEQEGGPNLHLRPPHPQPNR
jgi:hypothetical protein